MIKSQSVPVLVFPVTTTSTLLKVPSTSFQYYVRLQSQEYEVI